MTGEPTGRGLGEYLNSPNIMLKLKKLKRLCKPIKKMVCSCSCYEKEYWEEGGYSIHIFQSNNGKFYLTIEVPEGTFYWRIDRRPTQRLIKFYINDDVIIINRDIVVRGEVVVDIDKVGIC